jgi:hypothetical protein
MGDWLNLGKQNWLWMLIGIIFLTGIIAISTLLGNDVLQSCFWAITVSAAACVTGLLPMSKAIFQKQNVSAMSFLAGSIIRLLLMLFGTVIILVFVKVNVIWFAIWISLLYILMLAAEVIFAVQRMNTDNKIKEQKF